MQKPTKHTNRLHRIVTKHLHTHLFCNFSQLLLGLLIWDRCILYFHHILLDDRFNCFFHCLAVKHKLYRIISFLSLSLFPESHSPHDVWKIWLAFVCTKKIKRLRLKLLYVLIKKMLLNRIYTKFYINPPIYVIYVEI